MDSSDCDSSGLDSPNSSLSIARLKEYLRRKNRPSKREKKPSFLNVTISNDDPHLESFFVFFFFFFFLYFFFFSLPLLLGMPHTLNSHLQERSPTSVALLFLQSCLNAHCVLAYMRAGPIGGSFTNFTSLALQPLVFRQLSIESGFIIWPTGSQLHALSQGRAFLWFLVHAHSIGDGARRLQVADA